MSLLKSIAFALGVYMLPVTCISVKLSNMERAVACLRGVAGVGRQNASNVVAEKALPCLQRDGVHEDHHADALGDLLQQQLHPHARQGVPHQGDIVKVVVQYRLLASRSSLMCS